MRRIAQSGGELLEPESKLEAGAAASIASNQATTRRSGAKRALLFARRLHLYTGLFLVPFVVLYGLTGILFNRPDLWSSTEISTLRGRDLAAHGQVALPSVGDLTARVLAGLPDGWSLDESVRPRLRGQSLLTARAKVGVHDSGAEGPSAETRDKSATLLLPAGHEDALIFIRPESPDRVTDNAWPKGIASPPARDALLSLETAANDLLGMSEAVWRWRAAPRLELALFDPQGHPCRAECDLKTGSLRLESSAMESPSMRRILTRLHTAHGYPAQFGLGSLWAVMVDLMGLAMMAWAITGLCMWWQLRKLRRPGAVAAAIGILVAIGLGIAQAIATTP